MGKKDKKDKKDRKKRKDEDVESKALDLRFCPFSLGVAFDHVS